MYRAVENIINKIKITLICLKTILLIIKLAGRGYVDFLQSAVIDASDRAYACLLMNY